jgi:hypothetical protein
VGTGLTRRSFITVVLATGTTLTSGGRVSPWGAARAAAFQPVVDTSFGQFQGEQHGDPAASGLAWPTYDPPRRDDDLRPGARDHGRATRGGAAVLGARLIG